jgi:hypothetical protein
MVLIRCVRIDHKEGETDAQSAAEELMLLMYMGLLLHILSYVTRSKSEQRNFPSGKNGLALPL